MTKLAGSSRMALKNTRHLMAATIACMAYLISACSGQEPPPSAEPTGVIKTFYLKTGAKPATIKIDDSYINILQMPITLEENIEALTLRINYKTLMPAPKSPKIDFDVMTIQFQAYIDDYVDSWFDPKNPTYYSGYGVPAGELYDLEKRNITIALDNPDKQNRSFVLLRKAQGKYDLMIEYENANSRKDTEILCTMQKQRANALVMSIYFNSQRLAQWAEILAAAETFADKIIADEGTKYQSEEESR
jgi:hypothetical protein